MSNLKNETNAEINKSKIITAGKQITDVVIIILFTVVLLIVIGACSFAVKKHEQLVAIQLAYFIVGFFSTYLILIKLYSVGKNLETAFHLSDKEPY